jgi:hypothetical protein
MNEFSPAGAGMRVVQCSLSSVVADITDGEAGVPSSTSPTIALCSGKADVISSWMLPDVTDVGRRFNLKSAFSRFLWRRAAARQ